MRNGQCCGDFKTRTNLIWICVFLLWCWSPYFLFTLKRDGSEKSGFSFPFIDAAAVRFLNSDFCSRTDAVPDPIKNAEKGPRRVRMPQAGQASSFYTAIKWSNWPELACPFTSLSGFWVQVSPLGLAGSHFIMRVLTTNNNNNNVFRFRFRFRSTYESCVWAHKC